MLYRGNDKREFYLASLLYDSIEFRHIESVKSLLTEKGADPNLILPKKGISSFHLVIGCDSHDFALRVTSLILQNGGNPNVRSDEGLTPVHIAAAWGRVDILKLLLRNGGDPEVRDISHKTPLHYAAEEGFTDCLDLLGSYLPVKNDLINKEDESNICCLHLDKILINNGAVIGEYGVVENQSTDSIIVHNQDHLHSLPKTDTTEYILNWFTKQNYTTSNVNITESIANSLGDNSSDSFGTSNDSLAESDCDKESKRCDPKYITFRKVYKKSRSKSRSPKSPKMQNETLYVDASSEAKQLLTDSIYTDAVDFTQLREYSKESGIVTLASSTHVNSILSHASQNNIPRKSVVKQGENSDYLTCSHNSIDSIEKNIFEITDDLSSVSLNVKSDNAVYAPVEKANSVKYDDAASSSNDCSFISVSEVYKYIDKDQGVVLYERRLLKTPSEYAKSVKSSNVSSNLSSLPQDLDYDSDTLRKELTILGLNPGPITKTTKRVYLRKLHQLKKYPTAVKTNINEGKKKVYSLELEKTLRNSEWCNNIVAFRALEEVVNQQFSSPDPSRKWREGINKSSFTYLLLDPRVTNNLPYRFDSLKPLQVWETFLNAIFYVGKGKRSRPYQHLYDAVDLWKKEQYYSSSKKLQKILDIWKSGCGVICLHVFQNIIPVEAYTREAAMISAIKLENLTNLKSGEFYGVPATWPQKQKRMLGVYLLHKAMNIFLQEGERQLCPTDID